MLVQARTVHLSPTPEELRDYTERMPTCRITEFGSVNVQARVTSRSAGSTYVVAKGSSGKTMTREEFERIAAMQDEYLRGRDALVIDGYIGNDPEFRTRSRLSIETANANIAGMQKKLYFPRDDDAEPEVHVVYTPNLSAPGYPDDRVIAVDLENGLTRVVGADYFGESKKGGLRMWNKKVYDLGGLALHAGMKVIPTARGERVFMIIGLSGTGKTTTTFTTQNDSLPVQDDFVALMPGCKAYGTENGCFAKTFSLDPSFEPNIYRAVVKPTTYLENVFQDGSGKVNFFEQSHTQNGRAVFGMDDLERYRDAREVGPVDALLILNRNQDIIPAVAKLNDEQAAAYFMLGETTGTSAGGAAEAGRFLRVPGTNPFFPMPHGLQGNRILELLATHPIETYLLNTGRVGGPDGDERSKKVRIPDTSACVESIAEGSISWTEDDDFGYLVADNLPGIDDADLLRPRLLYERQGRMVEYVEVVDRLKRERVTRLEEFPELTPEIIKAAG